MSDEPDDVIGVLADEPGPKVVRVSQQLMQWMREARRLRDTIDEIRRCYGTLSEEERAEVPRMAWEIMSRGEHGPWDEIRALDHEGAQFCPACGSAVPAELGHHEH